MNSKSPEQGALQNNYRPVSAVQGKIAVHCENRTKQPVVRTQVSLILKQVVSIDTAFFLSMKQRSLTREFLETSELESSTRDEQGRFVHD
jgi:hypothetical protein